jgi:hypothetical protein
MAIFDNRARPAVIRVPVGDTGLAEGRMAGEKVLINQRDADMRPAPATGGAVRLQIAVMVQMMAQAVLFGAGAVAILLSPAAADDAGWWFAANVVGSFLIAAAVGWFLAPRLRARFWDTRKPLEDARAADLGVTSGR